MLFTLSDSYVQRFHTPLLTISCFVLIFYLPAGYQPVDALKDFNFAAVGDWGCNSNTDATVSNIRERKPELVLALGDLSTQSKADCWLDKIRSIESITKITIGNHENQPSEDYAKYMNRFGLTKPYYSYNYENVHILTMKIESRYLTNSSQYNFVVNDLRTAFQDPNVDWIIVSIHDWVYRSSSTNPHNDDLAEVYHPLFDQYDVDLVLSGHDHKYHRTYPLEFNLDNPASPKMTDNSNSDYIEPEGQVYVVVGTGGSQLGPIVGSSPFVVSQHDNFFGQLDIKFTNDGGKLEGKFYRNDDDKILDSFTITKNTSGGNKA